VFPFYEEVVLKELPVFSTQLEAITAAIFPQMEEEKIGLVNELLGVKKANKGFFLPLSAGAQILGVLLMWGKDLEESDLPAASLFAGHVAIALENAHLYTKIQHMAITDELTGLYNRRGLFEIGRREVERAQRYSHPLAAIMIDIDHFKKINDTYNHAIGDIVLRSFAECCLRNVREIDIVGRVGGEEFVILLPETDLPACQLVAERLRKRILENRTRTDLGDISITVSMGVASMTAKARDLSDLIRQADEALYIAKNSGRDRIAAGLSSTSQ
jgi:diguanylate cyclase (GGDEF)-like protein